MIPLSLASCSDWLEVEMEDKIMEPVLFSNYAGYVSAINGVYLSLNEYYIDGQLINILDVMAQYYHVTDDKQPHLPSIYHTLTRHHALNQKMRHYGTRLIL